MNSLEKAEQDTLPLLRQTMHFYEEHQFKFNLVLSKRKSEKLQKNIRETYEVFSSTHDTISENPSYGNLPDEEKLYRLRSLNKTMASMESDAPIHKRCKALFNGFKTFHRPEPLPQDKIKSSFTQTGLDITQNGQTKETEAAYSYAMGLALRS